MHLGYEVAFAEEYPRVFAVKHCTHFPLLLQITYVQFRVCNCAFEPNEESFMGFEHQHKLENREVNFSINLPPLLSLLTMRWHYCQLIFPFLQIFIQQHIKANLECFDTPQEPVQKFSSLANKIPILILHSVYIVLKYASH